MFKFFLKNSNNINNNNNNNNNKITTRCLGNFKGPMVSYLSAALSCEQRPFFLVTLHFSRGRATTNQTFFAGEAQSIARFITYSPPTG